MMSSPHNPYPPPPTCRDKDNIRSDPAGQSAPRDLPILLRRITSTHVTQQFVEIPHTLLHLTVGVGLHHHPLASTALPNPAEGTPVFGEKDALAVHLVVQELALVPLPVLPLHAPVATSLVVLPLPHVPTLPVPVVLALPVQFVVGELPLVETGPVLEVQLPQAVLLPLRPTPRISLAVVEHLAALPLGKTLPPLAVVGEPLSGEELAPALSLVVAKYPRVLISVSVGQHPMPFGFIFAPVTLVPRSVLPFQFAPPVALVIKHLSAVGGAISICYLFTSCLTFKDISNWFTIYL